MLIIEPIKAFDDNYIWLMTKNNKSVVVDPGDASEIVKLIDNQVINLEGVLITHHHYDHTNGLAELIAKKNLKVFGPKNNISEINNIVGDSDQFDLIGIHFEVLEIPGHTLDHIAFYSFNNGNPVLLCGDTLFAGGCGRVFEGTFSPEGLILSLERLLRPSQESQSYEPDQTRTRGELHPGGQAKFPGGPSANGAGRRGFSCRARSSPAHRRVDECHRCGPGRGRQTSL